MVLNWFAELLCLDGAVKNRGSEDTACDSETSMACCVQSFINDREAPHRSVESDKELMLRLLPPWFCPWCVSLVLVTGRWNSLESKTKASIHCLWFTFVETCQACQSACQSIPFVSACLGTSSGTLTHSDLSKTTMCVCVFSVCVCVSTSVTKSFECRGTAWLLTVAVQRRGCFESLIWILDAESTYLLTCNVHKLWLYSYRFWFMVLHDTSPKPFPLSAAELQSAAVEFLQMRINQLLKHLQLPGHFTLRFHRLFPLGNWVNWKPMSECDSLSRPTWVLGVILRKEAPFSLRNSCNRFNRFHHALDSLNWFGFTIVLSATYATRLHGISTWFDLVKAAGPKENKPKRVLYPKHPNPPPL